MILWFVFKWSSSSFLCLMALMAMCKRPESSKGCMGAAMNSWFVRAAVADACSLCLWRNKIWVKHKGNFFCNLSVDDRDCNATVWLSRVLPIMSMRKHKYKYVMFCKNTKQGFYYFLKIVNAQVHLRFLWECFCHALCLSSIKKSFVCFTCLCCKLPYYKVLESPHFMKIKMNCHKAIWYYQTGKL